MTWGEYYRYYLKELQCIYNANEAAAIVVIVFEEKASVKRTDIILFPKKNIDSNIKKILDNVLQQLLIHKPLQYILGSTIFCNLPFTVNEHVLIPRPETEELVQWIIDENKNENKSLLDIGTGSGCIPVALKKSLPAFEIASIDVSNEALTVAKKNAETNNTAVELRLLDFLNKDNWQRLSSFDIIVSNPPYIPHNEKEKLEKNVIAYEPHSALFVPDNSPLLFYEAIAAFSESHLNKTGKIYLEVHEDFADRTSDIFKKLFSIVEIKKDINGKSRMIKAANFLQ